MSQRWVPVIRPALFEAGDAARNNVHGAWAVKETGNNSLIYHRVRKGSENNQAGVRLK